MADRMRSLAPESSIAPADVQHHAIEVGHFRATFYRILPHLLLVNSKPVTLTPP